MEKERRNQMGESGKEYRCFGPPGTGKTTWLARQVRRAAIKHGPAGVLVTSFTKTAAVEIAERLKRADDDSPNIWIADRQVGTLHALCFHALGRPEIADVKKWIVEWNDAVAPHNRQSPAHGDVSDPLGDEAEGTLEGDLTRSQIEVCRARLVPTEKWPPALQSFWNKWEDFKRQTGTMDFTDLIETTLRDEIQPPGRPRVIFCDETQDHSKLELSLIRSWAKLQSVETLIVSGDDDQCQPGDTMVLCTGRKYVRMDQLDPEVHRVVSYYRMKSTTTGVRDGYAFAKAKRDYDGPIYTIKAGSRTTRATPDHHWLVRWNERAKKPGIHVVYLMQRGGWWRVGWCRLFRSDGVFHLGMRSHIEKADATWILRVFDDRTMASMYESIVAAAFGLPTATFEPVAGAIHFTRKSLRLLFETVREQSDLEGNARRCVSAHGGDYRFPIWSPKIARQKRGGSSLFVTRTTTLLQGLMDLPVDNEHPKRRNGVGWRVIDTVKHQHEKLAVYSLSIKPHETYVADGIVTHNCIFSFKGSSADAFLDPPIPDEQKKVLRQSYRLPRKVLAFSHKWIQQVSRREEKQFAPRAAEGVVRQLDGATWRQTDDLIDDVKRQVADGRSCMILASCSFMLMPTIAALKSQALPFHNPYRVKAGGWNPLRGGGRRVLDFLRPDPFTHGADARVWTWKELWHWIELLDVKKSGLIKGAKTFVSQQAKKREWAKQIVDKQNVKDIFGLEPENPLPWEVEGDELAWLGSKILTRLNRSSVAYALKVARTHGPPALTETPQIVVGTIHSIKGSEADVVYVYPDMSQAGMTSYLSPGEGRDSVVRAFYVAMTRAREELVWCAARTPMSISWDGI